MNTDMGFSVITITNRKNNINNVIQNFESQLFENKELIIVINKNDIDINEYKDKIQNKANISVYQLSQDINLGECLNFAVNKSIYKYIAKFDDDDYYSKFYLNEIYKGFLESDCKIVGKFKVFYYLEEINALAEVVAKSDNYENELTYMLKGSALCFDKEVFKNIKFQNRNLAEDSLFCKECTKKGYKIYATSKYNHIVFRDKNIQNHTWKEKSSFFLKLASVVYSDISFEDCKKIVDKEY